MKQVISLLMAALLAASLIGCGEKGNTAGNTSSKEKTSSITSEGTSTEETSQSSLQTEISSTTMEISQQTQSQVTTSKHQSITTTSKQTQAQASQPQQTTSSKDFRTNSSIMTSKSTPIEYLTLPEFKNIEINKFKQVLENEYGCKNVKYNIVDIWDTPLDDWQIETGVDKNKLYATRKEAANYVNKTGILCYTEPWKDAKIPKDGATLKCVIARGISIINNFPFSKTQTVVCPDNVRRSGKVTITRYEWTSGSLKIYFKNESSFKITAELTYEATDMNEKVTLSYWKLRARSLYPGQETYDAIPLDFLEGNYILMLRNLDFYAQI